MNCNSPKHLHNVPQIKEDQINGKNNEPSLATL